MVMASNQPLLIGNLIDHSINYFYSSLQSFALFETDKALLLKKKSSAGVFQTSC